MISFLTKERQEFLFTLAFEQMKLNGIQEENPHGIAHVKRVYQAFQAFYENGCYIENIEQSWLLEVAIILHDTGRGLESDPLYSECNGNHALISEKLFWTYKIPWLSNEEKKIVAYAIKWHNKGLKGLGIEKAETSQEVILQFLVLFDGIDGLYVPRIRAWAQETGMPEWDGSLSREMIKSYLVSGVKLPADKKNLSLLNNLLSNLNLLSEEEEVISFIWELIGNNEKTFRPWLEEQKEPVRREIEKIINEQ